MDEEVARMMEQWRNVVCPLAEVVDREILEINKIEKSLGEIPEQTRRIRALISRVDPLCYCHVFSNIDFIVDAIGLLTYPGSPYIDVLERCMLRGGQLPSEIKERANGYIYSLDSWLKGNTRGEALKDRPEYSKLVERIYSTMGEKTPHKEWLAASLAKTLKEHAYSPVDWLSQFPYDELVDQVYKTTLDRAPTGEEAELTQQRLKEGKTPISVIQSIVNSEEYMVKNLPANVVETASDRDFVVQIYGTLLDRRPSPDDLEFRVSEIRKSGSRDRIIQSVIHSRENINRQLALVAEALKAS